MKKKTLSVILSALMLLTIFTGCGSNEEQTTPALTVTTEQIPTTTDTDENTESVESTSDIEEVPVSEVTSDTQELAEVPSSVTTQIPVEELSQKQQNMLAIMDSLNMCMVENQCDYTPENPDFLWKALFYTIGNYPDLRDNEESGLITIDNSTGTMIVNYKLVQVYATGITESYSDLPALPEESYVSQGEDTEYYHFPMGDRGLSYGKIASWAENGDGTHTVETQLIGADDESLIAAFEYVLADNPYADGITDPMFLYTVRSVKKLE